MREKDLAVGKAYGMNGLGLIEIKNGIQIEIKESIGSDSFFYWFELGLKIDFKYNYNISFSSSHCLTLSCSAWNLVAN